MLGHRSLAGASLLASAAVVLSMATPAVSAGRSATSEPGAQVLYAAPDGQGSACTEREPCSLTGAQQHVRRVNGQMHSDIVVRLAPGDYRLTAPLQLDARDSGTGGHTVRWEGASGTVFNGGRRVTDWSPVRGKPGLWSAPAPRGLTNTRQLYVDGVRAQRARGVVPVSLTRTDSGYTASSAELAGWRNPSDMELVYTAGEALWNIERDGLGQWTEPRCPIAAVSGTQITMAQPCWDNSNRRVEFPDIPGRTVSMVGPGSLTNGGRPTYVENARELLDQPGEWYLDRSAHRFYYEPRRGEDLRRADVEAPELETLVRGDGTPTAPVHDISFDGIQFSYATWLGPSSNQGFSEIQAGYQITGSNGWATQGLCHYVDGGTCPFGAWTQEPGNVSLSYDHDMAFTDDVFAHLGAAGLQLGDGTQNATVRGNIVTDISGNGIEVGNVDKAQSTDPADRTREVTVADNHLYDLPREFHGGVAIINGYSQHDVITHNQINHVAYTAISMGWGGWPDKIGDPPTPNFSHDNVVSDNLIDDYMLMLDDGGGIYTQGITGTSMDTGEKVVGNVIHDQAGLGKNVYTDNGATYETVQGNVLYNASYANVASRHTDYRDDKGNNDPTLVTGNWWQTGDADSDNKGLVTKGNHLLSNPSAAPASIVDNAGLEPAYRGLLTRRVGGVAAPESPERVGSFAADGAVYVTWSSTIGNNGSPVDSYTATATAGAESHSTTISAEDFHRLGYALIPGLTNGTAYTATVTAHNSGGTSESSVPAAPVTPGALAGTTAKAPTGLKAHAGTDAVSLQWTPPADTGETPVIGYRITVSDGRTIMATGRDALVSQPTAKAMIRVVDGLQPGTKYTFTIAAVTADGVGAPATVSTTVENACDGAALLVTPSAVLARPGGQANVTTTLTNGCTTAMSGVQIALTGPAAYQISPAAPVAVADLPPGQSESATWTVTVPADAAPSAPLTARASFTADGGQHEAVTADGAVDVPASSLSALFDNVGITDDTNTGPGDLDGAGSSLSAQALAAAGVTPGSTVNAGGLPFSWPEIPPGQPDNVVAGGQAIDTSVSADSLGFLLAATYGPVTGTGQIVYADGTTQPYALTAPDWYSSSGGDAAITMNYRNRTGNVQQSHTITVSYATVPLQADKTVATVVLPNVSRTATSGKPAMHIFAMATPKGAIR